MSSESAPLLPKEKNYLFKRLIEISTEIVNEQIDIEKINDQKKEMIIKWFIDRLIKEHLKMLGYQILDLRKWQLKILNLK